MSVHPLSSVQADTLPRQERLSRELLQLVTQLESRQPANAGEAAALARMREEARLAAELAELIGRIQQYRRAPVHGITRAA
jgi:hypothetical protein